MYSFNRIIFLLVILVVSGCSWQFHRPEIGWTKGQVIERCGTPRDVNRTVTAGGATEQWIYWDPWLGIEMGIYYIYLHNGIVTGYQD